MKSRLFLLLFLIVSFSISAQETDLYSLMQERNEFYFSFQINDKSDLNQISKSISIDRVDGNIVTAYANSLSYKKFLATGIATTLMTPPSMQQEYKMFNGSRATYDWDSYPTYEAYESMMYEFATEHPDKCSIIELGTLNSGRKVMIARLNNGNPEGKPKFLYTSSMHGDEVTGYIMMLRLIDHLLTSNDPEVQNVMNNLDIFICPAANPDGTYHGGNNNIYGATRYNAEGIDLNRNYPDFEEGPHPDGCDYGVETVMFMQLAEDYKFTMGANFHGGAEVMNYPWDTWSPLHADDAWWQYVCHEYADLTHEVSSSYMSDYNNGITNGYAWYTISGSRQDYMNYYGECREVTIECSNDKTPSANQLPNFWSYNYNSIMAYMNQSLNGIHGIVTDSVTGTPIHATVTVNNHDEDYSKVTSHLPAGDYHRPIKGGTYTLTFTASGYYPKSYTVTVADNQAITLDVKLRAGEGIIPGFNASATSVALNGSINFTDATWGANLASWLWEFEGATPSTSTDQNPTGITYNQIGSYNVRLTVTNNNGESETILKSDYIHVSESYNMNNETITTCNAMFFDSGGADDCYGDDENYVMTFLPGNEGASIQVEFTSFNTEDRYDYLYIYDGASTSANQIGRYCGTTSPGTVTATNEDGALTFKFTSDQSENMMGWSAVVSCIGGTLTVTASADPESVEEGYTTQLTAVADGGTGNYTYSWTPAASLDDPTSATPVATPTESTTYVVTVSDGTSTASAEVAISVYVGIEEIDNELVAIYPNPSNSVINVTFANEINNIGWSLVNLQGQIVASSSDNSGKMLQISVEDVTPGLYYLSISVDGKNIIHKVVIK